MHPFLRKYHAVPANDAGPNFSRATVEALRGWAVCGAFSTEARAELARRVESTEAPVVADPVPEWLTRFSTGEMVAFGVAAGRAGYELGLGSLRLFFADRGVPCADDDLRRFREEAIKRAMREACNQGGPVFFHATVR